MNQIGSVIGDGTKDACLRHVIEIALCVGYIQGCIKSSRGWWQDRRTYWCIGVAVGKSGIRVCGGVLLKVRTWRKVSEYRRHAYLLVSPLFLVKVY